MGILDNEPDEAHPFDFESIQSKLDAKKEGGKTAEVTFDDFDPADDFEDVDGPEPKPDKDGGEESEEEPEDQPEPDAKDAPAPDAKVTPPQDPPTVDPATEQILRMVGDDAMLKIKGKEYRVGDLPKDEIQKYLQQGMRFYQAMEDVSSKERELAERESLIATQAKLILNRGGQPQDAPGAPRRESATIPPELQTNDEYDDDQVKALKAIGRQLYQEVGNLKTGFDQRSRTEGEQALLNEITTLESDYPLASPEVVVAVKAMYPTIPTERIMAESHKAFANDKFLDKLLKTCPDLERSLYERNVTKYLASKKKSKAIEGRPTSRGSVTKISTKPKPNKGINFDFDDAEAGAKEFMKRLQDSKEEFDLE